MDYVYAGLIILVAYLMGRGHERSRIRTLTNTHLRALLLRYIRGVRAKLPTEGDPIPLPELVAKFDEVEAEVEKFEFQITIGGPE